VLKERAIIWNKAGHNVIFISLGSCDGYGSPYKHPIIYDILTKLEFSQDQIKITFVNAIDLLKDHQKRMQKVGNNVQENSSSQKEDNLEFAFKMVEKAIGKEITGLEYKKILENHKIDYQNACDFYNATRQEGFTQHQDVYQLLKSYVEEHPNNTYYVDELPILLSKTCKSPLNHTCLASN
jgi:hypothetical protein